MDFQFCSLASSSAGNSYLVRAGNTNLLVDVGTTGKYIIEGLHQVGLTPTDISGILITHEHIDHVKSLKMIGRKAANAVVYGSEGTLDSQSEKLPEGRYKQVGACDRFQVGDIIVRTFRLSHDAVDPIGYSFEADGKMLTIITDTGITTGQMEEHILRSHAMVLEANHEVNILQMGPYPYSLKRRILGEYGHLSNETAGNALCDMIRDKTFTKTPPKILLGHLSNTNNTPEQARITVNNQLMEQDYYQGEHVHIDVAPRANLSKMIII